MAEDIKFQELQADNMSSKSSNEVSVDQIAETVNEIRGLVIGMLFSQGQFIGTDQRNRIATKCALKQRGSIKEYCNEFSKSLNGVDISEEFKIEMFLVGLREEIQSVVRKFNPNTFRLVVSLAELQEEVLANKSRAVEEEMKLEPQQFSHEDSKFTLLSLNKQSVSSRDDVVHNLHIVGESIDLARSNAHSCKECLVEIRRDVFDRMPKGNMIGRQLQMFEEWPTSQYIEKQAQLFEETQALKSLGTQSGNYSRKTCSYTLLNDLSIVDAKWEGTTVEGTKHTILYVTLKVLRMGDVEDSKTGVGMIEGNSIRRAYIHEFNPGFGMWCENKDVHDSSWIEWPDLPLPPPEPPPSYLCKNIVRGRSGKIGEKRVRKNKREKMLCVSSIEVTRMGATIVNEGTKAHLQWQGR